MNIEAAALKGRMREDLLVQCGVGLDPLDDQLGKRVTHARDRGVARITVRDELTNQRVIVRRDAVARIDVAVDANAGAAGRMPELDRSGRGHERARILGVDAAFDGVAAELHIGLRVGQLLAGRDRELRLDQIDTGNQFGHRMFDLNPRIHLNEIELPILVQELERAGTAITDRAARLDAALTHLPALLGSEARCRGLLDYFLMAALHRAVALAQTDHIAVMVAEHLKLDMPRAFEEFLHIYRVIAERGQRLGLGDRDRAQQRPLGVHHAHATPAAAARGLDDDRVADIAGDAQILFRIVAERAIGARHAGYLLATHDVYGRDFVAHEADGFGFRSDEGEAALLHALCEIGVLGQEAVTRVDRDRVRDFRGADDGWHIQVALRRGRRSNADRFVRQQHVLEAGVRGGMHRHGLDAQLATGAQNAQRDFAAIGDDDFFQHGERVIE